MRKLMALGLFALAAAAAQAAYLDIPLAGWQTFGGYNAPGNTFVNIALPAGTTIDAAEYIDLEYDAIGASWSSELVLSLNDTIVGIDFWDSKIAGAPNAPGVFGPVSASFANPGEFLSGPFVLTSGDLYVEAYESFNDGGNAVQDAAIRGGILRVHYTVPEPSSLTLIGMGVLALIRRR